jgi:purine-nucleoside phosphorylase
MTDCLVTKAEISASARQSSLDDMVKIALYTAVVA